MIIIVSPSYVKYGGEPSIAQANAKSFMHIYDLMSEAQTWLII
jgi:hypothetical protein